MFDTRLTALSADDVPVASAGDLGQLLLALGRQGRHQRLSVNSFAHAYDLAELVYFRYGLGGA